MRGLVQSLAKGAKTEGFSEDARAIANATMSSLCVTAQLEREEAQAETQKNKEIQESKGKKNNKKKGKKVKGKR